MFNVTVIDGKQLLKYIIVVVAILLIVILLKQTKKQEDVKQAIETTTQQIYSQSFLGCMDTSISSMRYLNSSEGTPKHSLVSGILNSELGLNNRIVAKSNLDVVIDTPLDIDDKSELINSEIPENIVTQVVEENNLKASYTDSYKNVAIKNKSGYELTEEMLVPDVSLENKKDIVIFHTHTCESYTPTENFNYEMTGNYRTTDINYSVARVGTELKGLLENRGYNVMHNTTLHDYPSYSGSYGNSMQTVNNILKDNNAQMLIDLHRDAVGNGSDYGPTVKINDETVAQLMIVIGTDAGGLEHPNWRENLKFAIKLQAKANEMYPGLFRPINLSTARYNQNLSKGAMIIEVGATGNTMEQSLGSMKYLASVIDEVMKEM